MHIYIYICMCLYIYTIFMCTLGCSTARARSEVTCRISWSLTYLSTYIDLSTYTCIYTYTVYIAPWVVARRVLAQKPRGASAGRPPIHLHIHNYLYLSVSLCILSIFAPWVTARHALARYSRDASAGRPPL